MTVNLAWRQYERGRAFELQQRMDDAVGAYRQAIALGPDFPEAYFALGRIQANRGHNAEALAMFDRAVALQPSAELLEWRAFVNGRLKRYEAALADYEQVLAGGETHARINLARILLALGRYDEAEQALRSCTDDAAAVLLEAMPRYREYASAEATEDGRAIRYLFGRTVLLGTLSDGGMRPRNVGGWLLTGAHLNITWQRFRVMAKVRRWQFDAVLGTGVLNGPVAAWAAIDLGIPRHETVAEAVSAGAQRVLLVSAVVDGAKQHIQLTKPIKDAGLSCMHLAFGFVPDGQPASDEPELVGVVGRAYVSWYRVAEHSRLERDPESTDARWPGWRLQIPFVDPNRPRVLVRIASEAAEAPPDRQRRKVVDYYHLHHPQVRAFEWEPRSDEERA